MHIDKLTKIDIITNDKNYQKETPMKELIKKNVEACKTLMLEAERWL